MKHTVHRKKVGFRTNSLHNKREPHAVHYLKQRASFWIATLCLFAFLIGNMMGQHGWHVFWASVLGKTDERAVIYAGTIAPIALLPDYDRWRGFGGNATEHTFRQVPQDILVPLPDYHFANAHMQSAYSVGHLGSYETGEDGSGSHPGVDIRVPIGTPVVSIANGIVWEVKEMTGFGKVIVVKHPNVPDPQNPSETTTLYSCYAHLSAQYVSEGSFVRKGEQIALSGDTGFASGPHLHFQIDNEEAPWHPYWPFTGADMRAIGMTTIQAVNAGLNQENARKYTISPLLYVQANYPTPPSLEDRVFARAEERRARGAPERETVVLLSEEDRDYIETTIAEETSLAETEEKTQPVIRAARLPRQRSQSRVQELIARAKSRKESRLARLKFRPTIVTVAKLETEEVKPAAVVPASVQQEVSHEISSISFRHDGEFSGRAWETMRISLLDEAGHTIQEPKLGRGLHLVTAYGEAEFKPQILKDKHFENGIAEVHILPRGRRTLVFKLEPLQTLSKPMRYVE